MQTNSLEQEVTTELQQSSTLIVGESRQAREMRDLAKRLGSTDLTVLIQGETGTGKEVTAKEIHRNGRQENLFVPVDCSCIPENLFESELFGHLKGSFTHAFQDRKGRFETAGNGTIFLDEIGTLPFHLQAKLLRVLQEQEFTPLGARMPVPMQARVIAGTNVDLWQAVQDRRFRNDLFYRLNVMPFEVCPLRERLEDVPPLVEYFLSRHLSGGTKKKITQEVLAPMCCYHWPGNIREVENAVRRAVFLAGEGDTIQPKHVLPWLKNTVVDNENVPRIKIQRDGKFLTLAELEDDYLIQILKHTAGNLTETALIAGIDQATLYRKRKKNPNLDAFESS